MPKRSKGAAAKYAALSQSKKSRRPRRSVPQVATLPAPHVESVPARTEQAVAQPAPSRTPIRTPVTTRRPRATQAQPSFISHDYVLTELKRIGVLAVGIIALLLVLSFIIP